MTWREADSSARLRIVATCVLVAGLVAAVAIFLAAQAPRPNPLGDPEDSKQYLREIQMYGGTANLLATEVREWIASLWHGKRLAYTVGTLSLLVSGGCFFVAGRLPLEGEDAAAGDSNPEAKPRS